MPGTKEPQAERRRQILAAAYRVAAERGLTGLRIGEIAARAGVSHGLVLFHFKSKRGLLLALLDWLLASTTVLHVGPDILALESPFDQLRALLRQEMDRLSSEPQRTRLTFDFWSASIRDATIRSKMRTEFDRYRAAFRPLADAVIAAHPARFRGVTGAALAAVSVSFIKGCAVQSMIAVGQFDIAEYLVAAERLILEAPARSSARPPSRVRAASRR
ncbi:MAG: TetR/AcrR family transcriptional regulator [Gemmatimonadetes bacterium]|nr:TetR/AcrR family transcriptional regulator [Gemmatimonadota bacterium]